MRILGLLLMLFPAALAAADRAQLSGIVRDPSGAVVERASVTAVHEQDGRRRSTHSNHGGYYALVSLPPGTYKVTVRKEGFQTVARLNFPLATGEAAELDFTLAVGSVREVVTIEGATGLMNVDDGSVGTMVAGERASRLPLNGRGVAGVLDLLPGVVATPASAGEAGQFSVNGQRANANYFTVDGVSANSAVAGGGVPAQFGGATLPAMTGFGSTHTLASLHELEDVRVQTSSFAPEYGRMPGAHVAVTTRAGSNEFHGTLFHSLRNERLSANDWFANRAGFGRAPQRLNNWGGALGGPLRRDRTFFFAAFEGLRLRQPYTWEALVPSPRARASAPARLRPLLNAFPVATGPEIARSLATYVARHSRPSRLDSGSLRIDHALTSRVSLFGRYHQSPSTTEFGSSYAERSAFRYRSFTLGVTSLVGSGLTHDLRVNTSTTSVTTRWLPQTAGGAVPVDLRDVVPYRGSAASPLFGVWIGGAGELVSGGAGRNRQGHWNAVTTINWTRGSHSLRFGADYQRLSPSRESALAAVMGTWSSMEELLSDQPVQTTVAEADAASSLIETLSLFVHDTWRPAARLAVTFGTRWELTPAPAMRETPASSLPRDPPPLIAVLPQPGGIPRPAGSEVVPTLARAITSGRQSSQLWPTRYGQFAPRIGAAYRLQERTVLRAGFGLFYDLGFSAATDPINGFPFNRWQFSADASLARFEPSFGRRYDPGLRLPYSVHWNATVERALRPSDFVAISYVGSSGRNLLRREGWFRPNTRMADVAVATNNGRSSYHGLQAQYRRMVARGLQGLASYAWSHSVDNGSWDSGVALVTPELPAHNDRGSSSFDVRHTFSAALTWDVPGPLRNWTASGIFRARTGFPVDVLTADNPFGLGFDNVTRPDLVPGMPVWLDDANAPGGRRLNAAAFRRVPLQRVQGTLGRNAITGFGMWQLDFALARQFNLSESVSLQFRADAANLLNRASFADPVRHLDNPLFGLPVSTLDLMLGSGSPRSGLSPAFQAGTPRTLQLGLRLVF